MISLHGFNVTLRRFLRQPLDTVPYTGLCGPVQALQRLHGGFRVSDFQRDQLLPCPVPAYGHGLFVSRSGERSPKFLGVPNFGETGPDLDRPAPFSCGAGLPKIGDCTKLCNQCRQVWRYWVPTVSPPTLFGLLRPLWRVLGGGGVLGLGSLCGRLGGRRKDDFIGITWAEGFPQQF